MTRSDIEHLAQVCVSLRSRLDEQEFKLFLDRMLWAIHASTGNPKFDEQRFIDHARGESAKVF